MELINKPEEFKIIEERQEQDYNYGKFTLFPLERGYAITLGNALRRVLLSSIPALAITGLRIPGKLHEFDVVEGVKEDLLEMSLNLKQVQLKIHDMKELVNIKEPIILQVAKKGIGDLLAEDIITPEGIEIANPKMKIASITKDISLEFEVFAEVGKGFVTSQELEHKNDIEYIYIDGLFSPILKVNYITENIRVGKKTDYDKLILEIWTKKNITPEEALKESTKILIEHFRFISEELLKILPGSESSEPVKDTSTDFSIEEKNEENDKNLYGISSEILDNPIDNLDLTKRAKNCLKRERINTVGELLAKTPDELMKIKNFGKKSLDEIMKEIKDKFGVDYDEIHENERRNSEQWDIELKEIN